MSSAPNTPLPIDLSLVSEPELLQWAQHFGRACQQVQWREPDKFYIYRSKLDRIERELEGRK